MPNPQVRWKLEGGYSDLLRGGVLEVELADQGALARLDLEPLSLFKRKRPIELLMRASHGFSGAIRGIGRWRARPNTELRCRFYFPGNSYLRNFRVPEGHFVVAWEISTTLEAAANVVGKRLVSIEAGAGLRHDWAVTFPRDVLFSQAMTTAWSRFRSPFSATQAAQTQDGEVHRFSWKGATSLEIPFSWEVGNGIVLPGRFPVLPLKSQAAWFAGLEGGLKLERKGDFALQLDRRRGRLRLKLEQNRSTSQGWAVQAGAGGQLRTRLGPLTLPQKDWRQEVARELAKPALRIADKHIDSALNRRIGVLLAARWETEKRRQVLFDAQWGEFQTGRDGSAYNRLLSGQFPPPGPGLKLSGLHETLLTRSFKIDLNVLDWVRLGVSRERSSYTRTSVNPDGTLLLEVGKAFRRDRQVWNNFQFYSFLEHLRSDSGERIAGFSWGQQRRFSRRALERILRAALHSGLIPEFDLPPPETFPTQINLVLAGRFTGGGLAKLRQVREGALFAALVRTLQWLEPELYRPGSFHWDWIESEKLRDLVETDPMQAWLESRYPVPGRSEFQRKQSVNTCSRVLKLLRLTRRWQDRDSELPPAKNSFGDIVESGLTLHGLLAFSALCPVQHRAGSLIITGDMTRAWGDPALIESLSSNPQTAIPE